MQEMGKKWQNPKNWPAQRVRHFSLCKRFQQYIKDPGKAMGCSRNTIIIHSLIKSLCPPLPPEYLVICHSQILQDNGPSLKQTSFTALGHSKSQNMLILPLWMDGLNLLIGGSLWVEGLQSKGLHNIVVLIIFRFYLIFFSLTNTIFSYGFGLLA